MFPGHVGPSVNTIEEFVEPGLIKEVGRVRIHMLIIRENLTKVGLIQEVHDMCEVCLSFPYECK